VADRRSRCAGIAPIGRQPRPALQPVLASRRLPGAAHLRGADAAPASMSLNTCAHPPPVCIQGAPCRLVGVAVHQVLAEPGSCKLRLQQRPRCRRRRTPTSRLCSVFAWRCACRSATARAARASGWAQKVSSANAAALRTGSANCQVSGVLRLQRASAVAQQPCAAQPKTSALRIGQAALAWPGTA